MHPIVWPIVERCIGRHVPPLQQGPVLGDLEEDFLKRVQADGRLRAEVWLVRESLSLARAYRSRAAGRARRSLMSMLHAEEIPLALRRLVKRPGASLASVLTLACGLAAAATTWSLLSAVLLSPLPVESPETLQVMGLQLQRQDGRPERPLYTHRYPSYGAVRDSGVFADVAAIGRYFLMVGEGGLHRSREVYFASHNFFEVLRVRLAAGAGFRPEDDQRGAPLVAVLSDRYWRTHFAADPQVVGKTITVGGSAATIVGVAPPGFRGLSLTTAPDLYMPLHALTSLIDPRMNYFMDGSSQSSPTSWLTIVGRMKAGEPVEGAATRLSAQLQNLSSDARRSGTPVFTDINTAALPEASRAGMRQFTRLLATTVGLLLLIGSLTVGMLLLIRTEARRDEFAMCLALGATRGRLATGVMLEGVLLTLGGVVLSVPLSVWMLAGVSAFKLPGGVDLALLELSAGMPTLIAAAGAAVVASALIGLVAGQFGRSADIGDVLRARAGATPRLTRRRLRMSLVGAQVAVSLVLLAGAGLFARSLISALNLNTTFEPARLVSGSVGVEAYGYSAPRASEFFNELQRRLQANPAIRSVAFSQSNGGMSGGGRLVLDGERQVMPSFVPFVEVDEHYFSAIGMSITRGRDFSSEDGPNTPPVIIVSESFGRLIASGGDPLGHTVTESFSRRGQPPGVARIVGVVPDVVTNVGALEPLAIYFPLAQKEPSTSRTITLRASADSALAIREAMATIRAIDPAITPAPFMTWQQRINLQMGPQQFGVTVLGALSAIAILLTVLGTYVLAETMAAARHREMGIRAALGATRRQLGELLLRETATLVGVGLIAGLGLAWLGAETIRAFLFQVEPLDVKTLATVSGLILVLTLIVSLRPAMRAGRVELSKLLRED